MQSITSSLSPITEFLSNFQTAFETKFKLEKRNAVRYINQAGHRFITTLLTEPTCCSNCGKLIFSYRGFTCRSCKLICHIRCLQEIVSKCVKDQPTAYGETAAATTTIDNRASQSTKQQHLTHKFEPKTFMKPTTCNHCGTILIGIIRQGLECSECNMTVHFKCKQFVCLDCQSSSSATTSSWAATTLAQLMSANNNQQRHHDSTIPSSMLEKTSKSKIKIDDFEIIKLIGTGSFSKVYLARLRKIDHSSSSDRAEFAIKVIKKTNPVIGSDPGSVFSELRTLKLGKSYPFLARLYCCFQSQDRLFLVMEHVVGIDLLHCLNRKFKKFREDQARFYAAEIALALIFLHNRQIVYRDLKLDNVIVDLDGHCKLIDFGMSKELFKTSTKRTRTFCGTPSYISPEIILELDYDYSVDWWSFGVLLYEMLLGHSPFYADCEDEIYKSILEEKVKIPEYLSLEAKSILSGLLTKDPKYRLGCEILEDCHIAIKRHPFFMFKISDGSRRHRWAELEKKQINPPFRPNEEDLDLVDYERRYDELDDLNQSPSSSSQLSRISQDDFLGFSYYSESFQSLCCVDLNR